MGSKFDRGQRFAAKAGARAARRPRLTGRFDRRGSTGARGLVACLCVAGVLAFAGCGEGSNRSADASSTATVSTATTTTKPTTATTPQTDSTPAKPASSKSDSKQTKTKSASTPAKPPAAKASTRPSTSAHKEPIFGKVRLTSTAFRAGGPIPVRYTCDGANISPPLEWGPIPHGTAEIFVLAIDLSGSASDAIQWAVAGIPPSATSIPEGRLPAGAVAGVNSEGKVGWGGICGAKGQLHRVGFLFYALKHPLDVKAGFDPVQVRSGLKGSILGTGLTLATYQRP